MITNRTFSRASVLDLFQRLPKAKTITLCAFCLTGARVRVCLSRLERNTAPGIPGTKIDTWLPSEWCRVTPSRYVSSGPGIEHLENRMQLPSKQRQRVFEAYKHLVSGIDAVVLGRSRLRLRKNLTNRSALGSFVVPRPC